MQSMQAIPVAPQPAAPPAEPSAARQTTHDDHFSKHLNDARRHIDRSRHTTKKTDDDTGNHEKNAARNNGTEKADSGKTGHIVHSDDGKKEDERGGNGKELLQQIPDNANPGHQAAASGQGTVNEQRLSIDNDAPIILKVQESTSIQNAGLTAAAQDRKSIVANLLAVVTGEQKTTTLGSTNTPQTQTGTQQGDIVVEHWQAQFNYTTAQENNGIPLSAQGDETLVAATREQMVNGTHISGNTNPKAFSAHTNANAKVSGQVTVQAVQTPVTPVADMDGGRPHGTPGTGLEAPAMPQDANSNYIHSNLPGATTIPDSDAAAGNKQQTGQGDQGAAKNFMQTPDLQMVTNQNGQDVPPVFSLDQTSAQSGQVSGQDSTGSLSLHLPSGIEIPHSQLIDQVTGHFAGNRSLESGTVTIRLHPAELGELRMEIKVEQDNIKAHITAQNPQVQDILDRNLPRLREALQQQGMNLEHIQVSVATDSGNSQLFQEQFNQRQFESPNRPNRDSVSFSLPEEDQEIPLPVDPDQNLSVHI